MAAHLAASLLLAAFRHRPVEQRVVARHPLARRRLLHVLQERREAPDQPLVAQRLRHSEERLQVHSSLRGAGAPRIADDLLDCELSLQRRQHLPLAVRQLDDLRVQHLRPLVQLVARLHPAPPGMPDAEHEQRLRRHQQVSLGVRLGGQEIAVRAHAEPLRHLYSRPQLVLRAGRRHLRRADHHVAAEGVALEHEVERLLQPLLRHLPGDERALRQVRRQQRLTHPPDRARL